MDIFSFQKYFFLEAAISKAFNSVCHYQIIFFVLGCLLLDCNNDKALGVFVSFGMLMSQAPFDLLLTEKRETLSLWGILVLYIHLLIFLIWGSEEDNTFTAEWELPEALLPAPSEATGTWIWLSSTKTREGKQAQWFAWQSDLIQFCFLHKRPISAVLSHLSNY